MKSKTTYLEVNDPNKTAGTKPQMDTTAKGIGVVLSQLRDLKETQEKSFDRIESRIDKVDDEVGRLHDLVSDSMREIATHGTRIDQQEKLIHEIRINLRAVERGQYECKARLNYEDQTGRVDVIQESLSKRRTPYEGLMLKQTTLGALAKYIIIAIASAIVGIGGIMATMWHKMNAEEERRQEAFMSRETTEPKLKKKPKKNDDELDPRDGTKIYE